MQFGTAENYAIRFLMYLSKHPDRTVPRWEASEMLCIPGDFLSKIAQKLKLCGLVKIKRGKNGGYQLKKKPDEITVLDVVENIKGKISLNKCINISDDRTCIMSSFCSIRNLWIEINEAVRNILKKKTIAELIKEEKKMIKKNSITLQYEE